MKSILRFIAMIVATIVFGILWEGVLKRLFGNVFDMHPLGYELSDMVGNVAFLILLVLGSEMVKKWIVNFVERAPSARSRDSKPARLAEVHKCHPLYLRVLGSAREEALEPSLENLNEEYLCTCAESGPELRSRIDRRFGWRLRWLLFATLVVAAKERARPLLGVLRKG